MKQILPPHQEAIDKEQQKSDSQTQGESLESTTKKPWCGGEPYKNDFPLFSSFADSGKPLVYLDSAATAQMPASVIDAIRNFQMSSRANVHRGIYDLAEKATEAYEGARARVARFLNAEPREIIFTKNTTESLNMIAHVLGASYFKPGDHVLVSRAEHHSNFLPWMLLRDTRGIILDIVDPDENGEISLPSIERAVCPKTRLAAFSHISHVLGTKNPIASYGALFQKHGVLFVVDAAQGIAHEPIDVESLECDFLAFSGHKVGGPMGIGVLYARPDIFHSAPPVMRGGGTIERVRVHEVLWDKSPSRFEAGTPNVEGAVGLRAALDYIDRVGYDAIREIDGRVTRALVDTLFPIPGVRIYGPRDTKKRSAIASFSVDGVHPHDLATILSRDGVSIRAGHHCAMPLMEFLDVPALSRASTWVYSSESDIEALGKSIEKAIRILKR